MKAFGASRGGTALRVAAASSLLAYAHGGLVLLFVAENPVADAGSSQVSELYDRGGLLPAGFGSTSSTTGAAADPKYADTRGYAFGDRRDVTGNASRLNVRPDV